jgi:hypothetical protein
MMGIRGPCIKIGKLNEVTFARQASLIRRGNDDRALNKESVHGSNFKRGASFQSIETWAEEGI